MMLALTPEMENVGWGLAAVGILLVSMSLLMGIRKKRRRASGRVTAQENLERYKAKADVRDDLQRVMVEVEEMAKRVSAQLDAKVIAVEKLVREADQRIARLEALGEAANTPASTPAQPITPAVTPPNGPTDELARRVYDLADQGHAAAQIARQLDEHIGKVELILALRSA